MWLVSRPSEPADQLIRVRDLTQTGVALSSQVGTVA
jgi:hypothetical protein